MRLTAAFTPQLANKASREFKSLASKVGGSVKSFLSTTPLGTSVADVNVLSFRKVKVNLEI